MQQHNKIFLVEDDEKICQILHDELEKWAYDVAVVSDFQKVLAEFQEFQPDLVLLDISLPYFNGYHWCQEIRKVSTVPILFLSSANDKMNQLMAMNMGGDDFIGKPVDLDLLVAKLQAVFRRNYTFIENDQELVYQEAVLNVLEGELRLGEKRVNLTPTETKIVALLFANAEKTVTKEAIMEKLWESEEFISKNTLTVNMTRLRKKLNANGFPTLIHTIKGMGYMLVKKDA
ncbi:two-component system response regulator protein BraR/BceR [Enterococcus sp. PF1-24]|uniref:response regulator transcription factor n=1 Tax=unclassified Enterococcus TaxID=2608891 RepID=UPI0024741C60|nr:MULTISPECIES: response regulator transcription factor [unclassified Enterococcus]MDH6363404.1 two-component system response regulator protein BraR/BceR [Enterococcus sp. PFB1-1]MDH6400498.1 two-component system response regulator protein BraR/BceR [Enterococcus sp. PF1-24]